MRVFTEHNRWEAGDGSGDLRDVGDTLLRLTGTSSVAVTTGRHTGFVPVRVVGGRPGPLDGWDAASEATVFSPKGRLSVPGLPDLPVSAGLVRIRVHARNRADAEAEEYELFAWPAPDAAPLVTLRADSLHRPSRSRRGGGTRVARPDRAAVWAVRRLTAGPPAGEPEWRYPSVTVRRDGIPDLADLPVGELSLRFTPAGPGRFTARWQAGPGATVPVPFEEPTSVEVTPGGTLLHHGVPAR